MLKRHVKELALIAVCTIYGIFAICINQNLFQQSNTSYYNFFLDALVHFRVNVLTAQHYDLSLFQGKWYLNWGPGPVLFILPFFLLNGVYSSDILYTLLGGILNCFLFYLLLIQCRNYFSMTVSWFSELFLFIGFALCSPNFYLSMTGGIWATEQIIATTYVLLSYVFLFVFLSKKKTVFFVLSLCFFTLSWLSRYTMIFSLPLFLLPFFMKRKYPKKQVKVLLTSFISITMVGFGILLWYNFLKFGNVFDTGLRYHHGALRYGDVIKQGKFISLVYIPYNFFYYFLNGITFSHLPPYVHTNAEGNSIFSLYPSIIFLFYLGKKISIFPKITKLFISLGLLVIASTMILLLSYFATGWRQLGIRYFLDVAPLAYLLLLFIIERIPRPLLLVVFIYEIFVNVFGTIGYFFHFPFH